MKKVILFLMFVAAVCVCADERTEMIRTFEAERAACRKKNENAMTTVDLTAGAGQFMTLAEKQILIALDHKLRITLDRAERLRILGDFARVNRDVKGILDASREGTGSLESFLRYNRIAYYLIRQINIWLADEIAEKRWKRICNAKGKVDGYDLEFQDGRCCFVAEMYDDTYILDAELYIDKTYSFEGRDFACFYTDLPDSMNDDFVTLYICEFKDGRIINFFKGKSAYYNDIIFKDGIFTIKYHGKEDVKVDIRKVFRR